MNSELPGQPTFDSVVSPPSTVSRILANIIDALLFIPIGIALVLAGVDPEDDVQTLTLVSTVLFFIYEIAAIAVYGTTVGKKAMGLRVVTVDGSQPSWTSSAVRYMVKTPEPLAALLVLTIAVDSSEIVDTLVLFWVLAVVVSIRIAADRRGWHDKASGLRVTKNDAKIAAERGQDYQGVPNWLNKQD